MSAGFAAEDEACSDTLSCLAGLLKGEVLEFEDVVVFLSVRRWKAWAAAAVLFEEGSFGEFDDRLFPPESF